MKKDTTENAILLGLDGKQNNGWVVSSTIRQLLAGKQPPSSVPYLFSDRFSRWLTVEKSNKILDVARLPAEDGTRTSYKCFGGKEFYRLPVGITKDGLSSVTGKVLNEIEIDEGNFPTSICMEPLRERIRTVISFLQFNQEGRIFAYTILDHSYIEGEYFQGLAEDYIVDLTSDRKPFPVESQKARKELAQSVADTILADFERDAFYPLFSKQELLDAIEGVLPEALRRLD